MKTLDLVWYHRGSPPTGIFERAKGEGGSYRRDFDSFNDAKCYNGKKEKELCYEMGSVDYLK